MNPLFTKKIMLTFCCALVIGFTWAQQQTPLQIALRYAEQSYDRWQLDKADLTDMMVTDQYRTEHNGVTHLYFLQSHARIPVYNAVMGVHVTAEGKVGFATSRFIPNVATKVNATIPMFSAEQAIIKAALQLDLPGKAAPVFISKSDRGELVFEDSSISQSPIKVRLMYQPLETGAVRLAWDLAIQQPNTPDYWSVRIDALTGDLLDKNNWTIYCHFLESETPHVHTDLCAPAQKNNFSPTTSTRDEAFLLPDFPFVDNAQYNVFPIPAESPLHGERQLVTNPADSMASPYGWHDTSGVAGADFFITRGNNVHAFQDSLDKDFSSNDEPRGGANLIFNFPFDNTKEPAAYRNASVTQLFYMTNIMHDFAYHYGFDEPAGNFQQNNFNKGGRGDDQVLAQAQDGGDVNNANFSAPPDGDNGAMQVYLWSTPNRAAPLLINMPASIAGTYTTEGASFGLQVSSTPVTGEIVAVVDNTSQPRLACGTITNGAQIAGKIALIERGTCTFVEKVRKAQAEGAIGVIICNTENTVVRMGGSDASITIPTVSISSTDCQKIRGALATGAVRAVIQLPSTVLPAELDAAFDNGITAHEFGHGISIRLTGGPLNSSCLRSDEQMGEGWSDFFSLVMTAKPGETGKEARGIGTYVFNQNTKALGIRRQRYSTDMTINTQTYDDVIGTQTSATNRAPHPLGEPWAGMLWDLYWKLSEVYGHDEDLYNGTGGNNLALQLIIDGMKLQACNPGFIDGRDAILAADLMKTDGANQCLIWEVFARRGLGWSAQQGDANNRNDGRQAFDLAPDCTKKLKIVKTATSLIEPGSDITYTIKVTNDKDSAATDVTVRDVLPQGTTYLTGSVSGANLLGAASSTVSFKLDKLLPGDEKTFSYKVSTSPSLYSKRLFFDNFENDTTNWRRETLAGQSRDAWKIDSQLTFRGRKVWFVPNTIRLNDQVLKTAQAFRVAGAQPVLRFYHNYDTDPGLDGGIVQISTDNGTTWQNTDSLLFRNGYRGRIAQRTFNNEKRNAFWGKSNAYIGSYIDLRPFIGKDILFRFRFGSAEQLNGTPSTGTGWSLDDLEIMDMFNYQSEACVTSAEGDQACAVAESRGTVVQSRLVTDTDEPENVFAKVTLYPNPAQAVVNVSIHTQQNEAATLRIFGADGRVLLQQKANLIPGNQVIPMNINALSAGFYVVEIKTENSVVTQKLVVN